MQRPLVIFNIATTFGFVGGLLLACRAETSPNPDHCHFAAGDQTCAERFGDERPFCVGPNDGCEGVLEHDGCVAKIPPDECYSPCGGGLFAVDDSSCLSAGDDAETEDGDGDGDGDTTGDGDGELEPVCGDGILGGDEECDDGNAIDEDECTNACTVATCGDGIIHRALGETCDDGNAVGGDSCTANCVVAGTVIWNRTYDFDQCRGYDVVLTSTGNIVVTAGCDGGWRLLSFDPDGEIAWNRTSIQGATHLSIGPADELAVGGSVNGQGQLRYFDSEGNYVWSENVPSPSSAIRGVAFDGTGNVYGAGNTPQEGFLSRYAPDGTLEWTEAQPGTQNTALVANASGYTWALWVSPVQLQTNFASGQPDWLNSSLGPAVAAGDVAIDAGDNAYVVGQTNVDLESFYVVQVDPSGEISWVTTHDDADILEVAFSVAALPNGGGALVAGWTNSDGINEERDGFLSWFGSDGGLLQDVWFDGDQNNDVDILQGVIVSSEGYAVAVGFHEDTGGGEVLWLVKVAT